MSKLVMSAQKLSDIGGERLDDNAVRALIMGAAAALDEYAKSDVFDFEAHKPVLRRILPGIEELMAVMDAAKETKQ